MKYSITTLLLFIVTSSISGSSIVIKPETEQPEVSATETVYVPADNPVIVAVFPPFDQA